MGNLADLDIFGNETPSGEPIIHYEGEAVNNALKLYFTSKRGETLYKPDEGGLYEQFLFKSINERNLDQLTFRIKNALNTGFVPKILILGINLVPDKENRLLSIQIRYSIEETQEIVETEININSQIESNPSYSYQDIPDISDNLYTFIQINKPNVPEGTLLEFNYSENSWVWYKFRLINFNFATDPRASDILKLANG